MSTFELEMASGLLREGLALEAQTQETIESELRAWNRKALRLLSEVKRIKHDLRQSAQMTKYVKTPCANEYYGKMNQTSRRLLAEKETELREAEGVVRMLQNLREGMNTL